MTDSSKQGTSDADLLRRAEAAVRNGEVAELGTILKGHPEVLQTRADDGQTLLSLACRAATGDVAIPPVAGTPEQHAAVDLILQSGADPSAAADNGWTPLHAAAMAGHVDLARRLLAAGAPRAGRYNGCAGGSPLALALFYAKGEVAELLAKPPVPDNLRHAAALGRPLARFFSGDQLTMAAADGLDFYGPPIFPVWERTLSRQEILDEALTWAARNDQCSSMDALVKLGANVNANPFRGTALLWAVYSDRVDAVRWLLDHGADPDLKHDFGGEGHGVGAVAMHLAAQYECLRSLELLLDRGADPNIKDDANGATVTGWAEFFGVDKALAVLKAR